MNNNENYRLLEINDRFVLIDKAPGIGFHREGEVPGIIEWVCADLGLESLLPVHRLDQMTSGLLLLARDAENARLLSEQFRLRRVHKFYLALTDRKPKRKQGLIVGDMAKTRRGSWKLCETLDRPAVTQFMSTSLSPGVRLFLLRPHTGKTHQLRVAMKSLGAPILGDRRYQGEGAGGWDRGYLHAYGLSFSLAGKEYRYLCRPQWGRLFTGEDFGEAVGQYADPWGLDWPRLKPGIGKEPG